MSNETDSEQAAAAHDENPKLKVTDRRMFDADGNPRQPDGDLAEASSEAPSPPDSAPVEETEKMPEAAPTPESAAPAPESTPPVEDPAPAPFAEVSSPAPATDPSSPTAATDPSGPTANAEDTRPDPASGSYADLPRGFAPFVESQYLEALIFLGAVPHPQTGETLEDPEFARYKIDLLTMIQEKTEGNLTDEESRMIEDVLYQLRMLFVQKTAPATK